MLEKVQLAGAGLLSLTVAVKTTTATGRMMGAFAEFERAVLRERTRNGLLAARQEGRIGGRRPKLTARQQQEVVRWWAPANERQPMLPGCWPRLGWVRRLSDFSEFCSGPH